MPLGSLIPCVLLSSVLEYQMALTLSKTAGSWPFGIDSHKIQSSLPSLFLNGFHWMKLIKSWNFPEQWSILKGQLALWRKECCLFNNPCISHSHLSLLVYHIELPLKHDCLTMFMCQSECSPCLTNGHIQKGQVISLTVLIMQHEQCPYWYCRLFRVVCERAESKWVHKQWDLRKQWEICSLICLMGILQLLWRSRWVLKASKLTRKKWVQHKGCRNYRPRNLCYRS